MAGAHHTTGIDGERDASLATVTCESARWHRRRVAE